MQAAMYTCFSILVFVCLVLSASAQQCNTTAVITYPFTFNQTNDSKAGKTNRLRLGIIGSFINAADVVVAKALAYEINNDPTILPDVGIDVYISTTPTTSDALLASMQHINSLKVNGLISGFTSTESRTVQLVAKIYSVPQISSNSLSYTLTNKDEYPYFMRTIPADTAQIEAIVALFQKFNWKKAVVIYTNDDYGSGYQRLAAAAAEYNISFFATGVSATATTRSQVESTVSSVVQAVNKEQYRIFVYYAQGGPANLVRAGLNESGLIGQDYVTILTSSITGFYTSGTNFALNDGVIGFHFSKPSGPTFNKFYNSWTSPTSTNPFPVQAVLPSSYYMADALLTFVHAYDTLLNSGTQFSDIKGSVLLNKIKSTTFNGTTGTVAFDSVGDREGNYAIFSITPTSSTEVGYYSKLDQKLVLNAPFVWGGGSSTVPRDSPYSCPSCQHGDCVQDVGCQCHKGWAGQNCDVSTSKGSNAGLYGGVAAAGVVMFAVIILAFFMYRRQRSRLVKEVADKQRSNIARADIKLSHRIGRGASGEVFKGSFRGTEVAVKKIITTTVNKAAVEEFELEVAIMCGLRHPNIILFMGSCYSAENNEMLLVMEFMTKGSLHDVLHNPKFTMSYETQLHLACQAAQGMNFLHQSVPPIIHRDLKSHNILLDDKWNARISDFGITKFKENSKETKAVHDKSIGTIYWSAPESLEGGEINEKVDVYSFGVVLWEIFHRQNPYAGRDPIAVALEVIHHNLRPPVSSLVPAEMQDLIRECWDKDPNKRPSFQDVMDKLRSMSMKNPNYSMGGATRNIEAPTGKVYLVNTNVQAAYTLWEKVPKAMTEAMTLHNNLIRSNLEMYRGYEAKYDFHNFMIAFGNLTDAMNFCIATQVSLLHVNWPSDIHKLSECAMSTSSDGHILWNGLRVQMSIFAGVPNCQHDPSSDRMTYMGAVVDKAQKLLRGIKKGSIVAHDTIIDEINKQSTKFIEPITTVKCGDMNESARTASIHQIFIDSLRERDTSTPGSPREEHPHVLLDVEEIQLPSSRSQKTSWEDNMKAQTADWIVQMKDLDLKDSVGKGSMGDYQRAIYKSKEVVVKTFVNQRLKEGDLLRLVSDSSMMSKMSHPNILPFHAVCLENDHLSMVFEYMPRGNLKAMLADSSIPLPLPKRLKIALEIAQGMSYLSHLSDADMSKHDNLKSNNIMIGKDWEVKICDYGQSNLKDLARTMTSVGSVAWTAPELLTGDAESTPKIATYSFGVILWELYTRQVPYANEHPIRVVNKILSGYRPPVPADCPENLSQLMSSCLDADPTERPSWESIISVLSSL